MLIQRLLAWVDEIISEVFWLQSWGDGDESWNNRWTYFVDLGPRIGIVGTNGIIHTIMGKWSVHHHYCGGTLLKRIPVRKDLKEGERLATKEEITQHLEDARRNSILYGGMVI